MNAETVLEMDAKTLTYEELEEALRVLQNRRHLVAARLALKKEMEEMDKALASAAA